jgi:altronate hydrolase
MARPASRSDVLRRTLGGYAKHPNFAGSLMIGLGCESNQISALLAPRICARATAAHVQHSGQRRHPQGDRGRHRAGSGKCWRPRTTSSAKWLPASHLTLRPAMRRDRTAIPGSPPTRRSVSAVDLLVENGGTAILSETPEIYGAEHLLTRRAVSSTVAEKLISRIKWWEEYTKRTGGEMNNNPSPGNKAGGLDDDPREVLGRCRQGRHDEPRRRIRIREPVTAKGFVFMDTPGYDRCRPTGQVAGGANMICFTTGRGSRTAARRHRRFKLATNTRSGTGRKKTSTSIAARSSMARTAVDEVGQKFFEMILDTASGRKTQERDAWVRARASSCRGSWVR